MTLSDVVPLSPKPRWGWSHRETAPGKSQGKSFRTLALFTPISDKKMAVTEVASLISL